MPTLNVKSACPSAVKTVLKVKFSTLGWNINFKPSIELSKNNPVTARKNNIIINKGIIILFACSIPLFTPLNGKIAHRKRKIIPIISGATGCAANVSKVAWLISLTGIVPNKYINI